MFGVIFGALPILLSLFTAKWTEVMNNGELLISSAAISGGALGELLYADVPSKEKLFRTIVGGFCVLACVCNTAAFVAAANFRDNMYGMSWGLFSATVVAGVSSIVLAAGR